MRAFFAKEYSGPPFQLFAPSHLVVLGIIALVNFSFFYVRLYPIGSCSQYCRYGLASALLLNELAYHFWRWKTGQWTLQKMLPLHLCAILVYLSAFVLITQHDLAYQFLYFLGIGGAAQALLTPEVDGYGFRHFRVFQTFISHGLIVTAAVYMTVVEGFRPSWMSLLYVAVGINGYMLLVGMVNVVLGSNYMFLARKPETASVLDVLGPWPWYILWMEVIGVVLCLLLYAPFAILDWGVWSAG
ncbi:TIGR02206 family membrane protein [candidate division KSB3 bacterium]|uniref:TIGR02206 family membrane protein n=1 Tax=candidate division KSB3 bacterium TaxID=2044937 RepID=A0A9D5JX86_9BACT|nr:TIGR02206 family membrane protein [candidate division KSB3 bacterium]MBD3325818.1 TIGR02206 family membrane protein [candidate division KSB3 bacterium]